MRIETADLTQPKGWLCGPWDSALAVSVGFASRGIDEPHFHQQITEIYLIAGGTARMRVENETVELRPGQVIILSPGEAHTFLDSSSDHIHFVVQTPGLYGQVAQADKVLVPRSRLGL